MSILHRRQTRAAVVVLCCGLLAATWGCREVSDPCPAATLTVTPDPLRLPAGTVGLFTAIARDYKGNPVATSPVWSVVGSGGNIDDETGLFTAGVTTGTFTGTVQAVDGAVSALATVIVTAPVPTAGLGTLETFAVVAGSTVTVNGATTTIAGNVGVSPGTAVTGMPAGQPTGGVVHAGNATAATAQTSLTSLYNDLAGRACGTDLTGEDLGGMTLTPGIYCFDTTAGLTGTLTLNGQGNTDAVFIIKVGSTLTTASNAVVTLTGGARAANVFWQVGSSATLGTGTAFQGNLVAMTSITINTGSGLVGRALARSGAVTIDASALALP
jgi:hypothetical protein